MVNIGNDSVDAIMFDSYYAPLANKDLVVDTIVSKDNSTTAESPEGTWEINDGWEVEFVDNKIIKINRFKIDTWGIRHKVSSSSANSAKYKQMIVEVTGLSYVHQNIIKANAESEDVTGFVPAYVGTGGYVVEWRPGLFTSGNYVQGLVIQGQMCYTDEWNDARNSSYAMGRAPWEINGNIDRFVKDGIRPQGMMTGGGCSAFCIGLFGGCQTSSAINDTENGAYKIYDITNHPIYINLNVKDMTVPIDASTVECWDVMQGEDNIYHKDRTVENCWKEYGFLEEITDKNGNQCFSMNMSGIPSEITNPILPPVADLEDFLLPGISSGKPYIIFNHKIANTEYWNVIKAFYATHPIIWVNSDDDNYSDYTVDDNCIPVALFKGSCMTGDLKFVFDGNSKYFSLSEPFNSCTFDKVTFEFRHNTMMSSTHRLFRGASIKEFEVIDEYDNPYLLGTNDCSAMFEGNSQLQVCNAIFNWGRNYSWNDTNIAYMFSACTALTEFKGRTDVEDIISVDSFCDQAFQMCRSLTTIEPILNMVRVNITNSSGAYKMFEDCWLLENVKIKNLNGSQVYLNNNGKVGVLPKLNAASIQYLFDNLIDCNTYKENIGVETVNNSWRLWDFNNYLHVSYGTLKLSRRLPDIDEKFHAKPIASVNATLVISGLLDIDKLIWRTTTDTILTNGENNITGDGVLILTRDGISEPITDDSKLVSISFNNPHNPFIAKSPSAELHCLLNWKGTFDFRLINTSDNSTTLAISTRNPTSNPNSYTYTDCPAKIKIKVEGLVDGDVLGVGSGSYTTIPNKIIEDGIYEFEFGSSWGFKLWNTNTSITSPVVITSLQFENSKITDDMVRAANQKKWKIYVGGEEYIISD